VAKFLTDPGLIPVDEPDFWYLDSPLIYVSATYTITIPVGFVTDLASIPHALDWIPFLDRDGFSRRPGCLHDGIYNLGRIKGKDFADGVLREACLAEGMSAWEAWCYFKGVQWFGASAWDKDAHHDTYGAIASGNFIDKAHFEAWVAAGASIYST
jgi:Protein of unknown function (DUF1353)